VNEILFLSDNVQEVDAAITAGMHSVVVDRPGNVVLDEDDLMEFMVVESLEAIELAE
jgi:enolase-phosphatase E1